MRREPAARYDSSEFGEIGELLFKIKLISAEGESYPVSKRDKSIRFEHQFLWGRLLELDSDELLLEISN